MDVRSALHQRGVEVRDATVGDEVDGVTPHLVVVPTSTEEVSAALASATAADASVAVACHRTKQTWGNPVAPADLLVDMSRMTALIEHQPGDLIASAQAGMSLADLQQRLTPSGQRLGIDEMVSGTSVGGLIATNPSGPRRLHTGTVRDLLIGLTVVRADGTIAHAGGKVVKNVAGYDLCKLMTGSFGTLGVITEATFRLHPLPAASRVLTRELRHGELAALLSALVHSQLAPSAVEIDCAGEESVTVAVLLEGTPEGVEARSHTLTDLLGEDAREEDLSWFEHYPFETGGTQTGLKITCRLSQVADMSRLATRFGFHVRGSAGTGVLYAGAAAGSTLDDLRTALEALRGAAAQAGGSVTVVDGPREVRAGLDLWGPVNGLAVMRRIKDEFDPGRHLQAGRFVGGI